MSCLQGGRYRVFRKDTGACVGIYVKRETARMFISRQREPDKYYIQFKDLYYAH